MSTEPVPPPGAPPAATSPAAAPPAAPPPGTRRSRPLWVYIAGVIAVIVIGSLLIKALEPPAPDPHCDPVLDVCSDPPPGDPGDSPGSSLPPTEPEGTPVAYVSGETWTSSKLGFQVVYDAKKWSVLNEGETWVVLESKDKVGAWAVFEGALASEVTVEGLLQAELDLYKESYTSIEEDDDPYKAIVGAHIAYVDGIGRSYVATGKGSDGLPLKPLGLGMIGSTDGRLVVAFIMEVENPDKLLDDETTRELWLRGRGDTLLKDFRWGQ